MTQLDPKLTKEISNLIKKLLKSKSIYYWISLSHCLNALIYFKIPKTQDDIKINKEMLCLLEELSESRTPHDWTEKESYLKLKKTLTKIQRLLKKITPDFPK